MHEILKYLKTHGDRLDNDIAQDLSMSLDKARPGFIHYLRCAMGTEPSGRSAWKSGLSDDRQPAGFELYATAPDGHEQTRQKKLLWHDRRWINLSSEGDLAALKRNFQQSFKAMREQGLVESIEDCKSWYL